MHVMYCIVLMSVTYTYRYISPIRPDVYILRELRKRCIFLEGFTLGMCGIGREVTITQKDPASMWKAVSRSELRCGTGDAEWGEEPRKQRESGPLGMPSYKGTRGRSLKLSLGQLFLSCVTRYIC